MGKVAQAAGTDEQRTDSNSSGAKRYAGQGEAVFHFVAEETSSVNRAMAGAPIEAMSVITTIEKAPWRSRRWCGVNIWKQARAYPRNGWTRTL